MRWARDFISLKNIYIEAGRAPRKEAGRASQNSCCKRIDKTL